MAKRTWFVGVASIVAAALTVGSAQQAPVFRSGVDLITVDATVVDGQGNPIPNLGPDDFTLKVDSQPRRVVSVQFVSRVSTSPAAPTAAETPATAAASSNAAAAEGRLVLVAVDQSNIRRLEGRQALRAAERFIDALGPSDRVAVAGVNYEGDLEFSKDRARAKRQLNALTGEAVPALIQPDFNLGLSEALWIVLQALRQQAAQGYLVGLARR
jgi:VWFA-related protein